MIGDKIKELREGRMITQSQMAEQTGININTLASYERNIREPRIEVIIQLCEYFGVSSDYLLGISAYQNPAHCDSVDAAFQKLPLDMQERCTRIQLAFVRAADTFQWYGKLLRTAPDLFQYLADDVNRCIEVYSQLVESNTPETNWESRPEFFVEQFLYGMAQMRETEPKVIDCIYRHGYIGTGIAAKEGPQNG